ncbi:hypothetical protein COTS27_01591 [Spirochaetota bacterium]|nr:hypothetical protein COTS27_01591 [Spirochaetota bacterium]
MNFFTLLRGLIGKFFVCGVIFYGVVLYGQNSTDQNSFSSDAASLITINEVKKQLTKKFATYKTYQANFKEVFRGKLRQGKIFIKKPHQVRLTYYLRDRIDMDVFGTEKLLYVYLPKYNIVYEQELGDSADQEFQGIKAASLDFLFANYAFDFYENEDLVPIFDAETKTLFNIISPATTNAYKLRLSAKDITRGLDSLTLWVSEAGLILRSRARSIDKKTVDLYFYDIVLNTPIPDNKFEFVIESSVRIIRDSFQ